MAHDKVHMFRPDWYLSMVLIILNSVPQSLNLARPIIPTGQLQRLA